MKPIEGDLSDVPRPAASVVMLREAPGGPEVFLLRRHGAADVLGGVFVFPGGKVDASDSVLDVSVHLDQSPAQLHASLGEPDLSPGGAAALYIAAARELFEEAGVLLTEGITPVVEASASADLQSGISFNDVLRAGSLQLDTEGLVPWSRWITPKASLNMRKRFDTRFFVAVVPDGLSARHADRESTESAWLTPRAALERYWANEIVLAAPQIMTLAHLSRFDSAEAVLADARSRRPPTIAPEHFEAGGERFICYPGDALHPVRERAMPGPLRVAFRNGRHEPVDGFESLFA